MTKLICGWCRNDFEEKISKGRDGCRNLLICPHCHCNRLLPSSKKEPTESIVGRKHIHTEWKNGDVAG